MRAISSGGAMLSEQKFRIALSREALKYYNKVSTNTAERLDRCLGNLESNPIQGQNIKPLQGIADKFRYRVGNLRVIYELDLSEKTVYIIAILPRGQAYKR